MLIRISIMAQRLLDVIAPTSPPVETFFILQEDGNLILQEDNSSGIQQESVNG